MSNHRSQKKKVMEDSYWNYFLKLESDFHATARYIGCSKANDTTCSIEFAQQLVCISTECESLLKKLCKTIDPKNPAANMGHYKQAMLKKFPKMHTASVRVDRFHRTEHPFGGWNGSGSRLEWWNAFQDIKYHRDNNFEKANLNNTLNALSALLILEIYLYGVFSSEGLERLGSTLLLWAPGMPRSPEPVPSTEFLPHLPIRTKE